AVGDVAPVEIGEPAGPHSADSPQQTLPYPGAGLARGTPIINQRLTKSLLLKRGLPCGYAPHTCTSPSPPEEAPTFRPGRNPAPGKGGPAKPGQPKARSAQDLLLSLTDQAKEW